jgi:hypothetical protein
MALFTLLIVSIQNEGYRFWNFECKYQSQQQKHKRKKKSKNDEAMLSSNVPQVAQNSLEHILCPQQTWTL